MIKILVSLFLLIIIIFTILFSLLYFSFNLGNPNNTINNNYRKNIIKNHLLRSILKLNKIGDARFDYANRNQFESLKIVINYQLGEALHRETIGAIPVEFEKIINKPRGIEITEKNLNEVLPDSLKDSDLNRLSKSFPTKFSISKKQAFLQIFVLKKYSPYPTYTGLVRDSSNIFIFMDSIREISDREKSTQKAEISTILHEFGHLLGADHVDDETCIMAQKVEDLTNGLPNNMTTAYCPLDLEKIQKSLN